MTDDLQAALQEWMQQFVRGGTDDIAGDGGQTYYYDYSELPERLERLLRRVGMIALENDYRGPGEWTPEKCVDAAILSALQQGQDGP